MNERASWLAQVSEPILEPDLPIIDPHHHLWDNRSEFPYPRYMIEEFSADLATGHNVTATVFVECGTTFRCDGPEAMRYVGETEFVVGQSAMSRSGVYGKTDIAQAIVGMADLRLGTGVGDVLDAHIAAAGGRFRGVRLGAVWHQDDAIANHRTNPPQHLFLDRGFRDGFAQLAPRDLSFDSWCYHTQLDDLHDLARTFPDTRVVVNHLGGPIGIGPYAGRPEEVFREWLDAIRPLATCPNVHMKLGGFAMDINGFGWHQRDRPPTSEEYAAASSRYYKAAIELFSPHRCMLAYPVNAHDRYM